jgi:DNA invertase Pin-like site-specific DNA recombinase
VTRHDDISVADRAGLAGAAEGGNPNGQRGDSIVRPTVTPRNGGPLRSKHAPNHHATYSCGERRLIGYITVHDGASGAPDDQEVAIRRACELCNWQLANVVTDRDSGRRSLDRPGIGYALDQIARGRADGLVVSEVVRLVRSQVDMAALMHWFREHNAALIALDLDIDTSTAEGRRIANVLIALGDWEQDRISQRTRSGLADAKASGKPVGRPSINDRPGLREQIQRMRASGMTLWAIADSLNAAGVATSRGGARWRPSSVQAGLGYRRPSARDARRVAKTVWSEPSSATSKTGSNGNGLE